MQTLHPDFPQHIGFIGTGLMGKPMCQRLLDAGWSLTVWNRSREKTDELINAGAVYAESPAALKEQVDIVCLCLSDAEAVKAVVSGEQGLLNARGAKVLVDFSSIDPDTTRELSEKLRQNDCQWIDAPVSGGVPGAEQGTLVILCGGPEEIIAKLNKVFAPLSQRVTHMGPVGAGQIAKLCNQMIVACNVVAIAEAMSFGQHNGINIKELPAALAGGFADSIPLQLLGPRMASGDYEPPLGKLATMLKDIDSATGIGKKITMPIPLCEAAVGVYRLAADKGMSGQDFAALYELYQQSV